MRTLLLNIVLTLTVISTNAQIVNIPDTNFKAALIAHSPIIDTNGDGEIQVSEASSSIYSLYINNKQIHDLTGIEAFINCTSIDCSHNYLSSIDISNNTKIHSLRCYENQLTSLDISNNDSIINLYCYENQLTSLNISNLTKLRYLDCSNNILTSLDLVNNDSLQTLSCRDNNLTTLDISNNINLTQLIADDNQITSLDVSNNIKLIGIYLINNQISYLDVSNLTLLENLNLNNNQLSSIDISNNLNLYRLHIGDNLFTDINVENNVSLVYLWCFGNQLTSLDLTNNLFLRWLECNNNLLTSLDLTNNDSLQTLWCHYNQITSIDLSTKPIFYNLACYNNSLSELNVKNGNNSNFLNFNVYNNPNLFCIQVDDDIYSTNYWTYIDAWSSFGENCLYDINNPNKIYGNVVADNNCIVDGNEQAMENIIVKTDPFNFYGVTDSTGAYTISTDTGIYQVKQIITHPFISPLCPMPNYHTVVFDTLAQDTTDINFFNEVVECPLLSVDISSNFRRRCFTSSTYIEYCNTGFADASGVEVTVQLPEYVILVSADYPYTIDTSGNYIFNIGNLAQGECGTINIIDSVACINNIIGLTQCSKAWITPPNNCLDSLDANFNAWDKSEVAVTGKCLSDTIVRFTITNTGDFGIGDMEASQEYRIFVDGALAITEMFQLNGEESINIDYPSNGQTIRLEADQHPMHPGNSHPQETIEACGDDNGQISIGYVNTFPMDDLDYDIEIECLPIIDSFDPNEKTVSPSGITDNHYVNAGTLLDYQIRFQNTGTDTAFTVVVVDELSEHLNPSTIQWGISSHPYTIDITGMGTPTLKFTFNNINLPDSNTNELASHGFIKFKVAPYDTLANGTEINNTAFIYFDYNLPIVTNTAQVVISDTVLTYSPLIVETISKENISIYPNPTTGKITIEGKDIEQVEIYNISGVLIKTTTNKEIDLSNQAKGVYFVKVIAKEGTITKKIILE